MAYPIKLIRRDVSSKVTTDLLVVFLVLIVVCGLSLGALWFLQRVRRSREPSLLPTHNGEKLSAPRKKGHHRLSAISIASTVSLEKHQAQSKFVEEEKQEFIANTSPPPSAGLPQIRVTFPEEPDESGKQQSGRVVVVHVDDKGSVGMEPVSEAEHSTHQQQHERFVSLDLERIGGLKEKERGGAQPLPGTAA